MEMMFGSMLESSHPVRYVIPLNEWVPVYTSASGMAIMAYLPRSQREQIIGRTKLAPLTPRGITDPTLLEEELARIRSQGYSCTHGQRTLGAVGVAAPIFRGHDAQVIGDLLLTIPEQRFDESRVPEFASMVMEFANRVTRKIGGRLPTPAELDQL
jgi:DNA-binding IclR family transcriptional regulator